MAHIYSAFVFILSHGWNKPVPEDFLNSKVEDTSHRSVPKVCNITARHIFTH